ncbi:major capsid protein [robinz microvirus RP_35]|nr:major capsid protein [robinz microvirus RP_35]
MKRSKCSLSHHKLFTCDMGELVPIGCFEVLPGDTLQQSTSMLLRVSPLLTPVMHPVRVRIHHWFVPNRLLWDDWEDFITGGPDGMDASVHPYKNLVDVGVEGSLGDYLGIPGGATVPTPISALPFRAYAMIYNENYRDQDLQAEIPLVTTSGADITTNNDLLKVCWEKDYFTSSRPWTQKGPDVTIPFATSAPVLGSGSPVFNVAGGSHPLASSAGAAAHAMWGGGAAATDTTATWNTTALTADLSSATAISINDLREAFALQRYEEARARYGSRYVEYLRYLGVRPSDARLQRPEYLGGGLQTIQFSEVLQTSEGDTTPLGEMAGHGISAMRSNRYRRFFEEHGLVLSLMSVLPKTMYTNGINRGWLRATKEDYFQKELQHIGQQEIHNAEVYAPHVAPLGTFGYQDRYDEYRRMESQVHGEFRSTLNMWHYARDFGAPPALNASFVEADPTKRVNAVTSNDVLWCMARHSIQARRMVSYQGNSFIQ